MFENAGIQSLYTALLLITILSQRISYPYSILSIAAQSNPFDAVRPECQIGAYKLAAGMSGPRVFRAESNNIRWLRRLLVFVSKGGDMAAAGSTGTRSMYQQGLGLIPDKAHCYLIFQCRLNRVSIDLMAFAWQHLLAIEFSQDLD